MKSATQPNARPFELAAIDVIQLHARAILLELRKLDDETLFDSDDIKILRDTIDMLARGEGFDFERVQDGFNDCDFAYEVGAGK